jgi:MSHA biogenesis protein MshJ
VKALWNLQAARLDAMPNRERILAFCAAVGVLFLVMYVGLLDPAGGRLRQLRQQLAADQDAVDALDRQKQALVAELQTHPDEPFLRRIEAADRGIADLDREIQALGAGLAAPERMAGLVKEVLARSPQIALVAMRNLPPTPLIEQPAGAPDANGAALPRAGELYRHGIEITVEGPWPALVGYAGRLESLPARVLWHRTRVDAAAWPRVTMTLNLYTLSLERTWLTL